MAGEVAADDKGEALKDDGIDDALDEGWEEKLLFPEEKSRSVTVVVFFFLKSAGKINCCAGVRWEAKLGGRL